MVVILLILIICLGTGLPVQAHPHDNKFWKFANWTARQHTNESCYVCQVFPTSATTTSLKPRNDTLDTTLTVMAQICISETCISGKTTEKGHENQHIRYLKRTGARWCANNTNDEFFCINALRTALKMDQKGTAFVKDFQALQGPNHQYTVCVTARGNIFLGNLATKSCNKTYTACELGQENASTSTQVKPALRGSRTGTGWWGGTCALTQFTSHLSIVKGNRTHNVHHKRSTNDPTFPPREHQLKTKVAKFWDAIFPQYGVTQLWNQIEVTHYRLATFANETLQAMEGVRSELTALRLTAIQNRMALDMLLAEKGGVCAVVGDSCCTFIPDHDDAHGEIGQAVEKMRKTVEAIKEDEKGDRTGWGLWYILFGQWTPYLSMIVPVLFILLLLCLCGPCILQCLQSMLHRMISGYQLIPRVSEYYPIPMQGK
ncbi:hypothetical protein Q7C36_021698 [Tachysurus vachellii]|uniref:Envelope protein n=1 Tax=Tachysurus vachellii TaxID=175792 RepID=A0AA88LPX5_TACVA|nr:hypothetical protein Q7C36_021698 [Tachysurus vachellii]